MGKKRSSSKSANDIFILDCEEEYEESFFENEVPSGKVFASFNFSGEAAPIISDVPNKLDIESTEKLNIEVPEKLNPEIPEKLIDNRKLQKKPYGITPPVDGERFEVTRTFVFRRSTVRMLNRLKAEHKDENAYLSSIVDEALRFYYKHIFEEKKDRQ